MNKPRTSDNRSNDNRGENRGNNRRPSNQGGGNRDRNFKGGERREHGKPSFDRNTKTENRTGGKVGSVSNTQRVVKKDFVKYDTSLIKLSGDKTLCSFYVEHEHNIENTIEIFKIILNSEVDNVIVSISSDDFSETIAQFESVFGEYKDIVQYVQYSPRMKELKVHNEAFKMHASDIFFVTNSSMEPREYAIEILRKYLSREYSVTVVPTIYNTALEIQKYCLRFPSLFAKLMCILGCKKTEEKLIMMERGNVGYYKIHRTDASLSQALVINSSIFRKVGMFSTCRDTAHSLLSFYKKLNKYGTVLFVPTARFIEHKTRQNKCCFFSKTCYFLKNVF